MGREANVRVEMRCWLSGRQGFMWLQILGR